MREKLANVLWGLVLIVVGVTVFGKVMGFWELPALFPGWWTLFIIFPSFVSMIKNGIRPVNSIFLLCGVFLLLEQNHMIERGTLGKALVPMIFFVIGLCLLLRSLLGGTKHSYKGTKGYSATFGGNVAVPTEMPFDGCEADAVFGGLDLDLRDCTIQDGAVIEASAIFGGIDIKVPQGVSVKVKRTELFGGAKSHIDNHSGEPVLYVNALCMFGGVDIK
ncbi:MAG: hypothetical protein J6J38_12310 [Lachnospiraceae bacterium]|nr:hypothetical protein [Lachnospiraceae bacterium]